jgi:hypothetical protein
MQGDRKYGSVGNALQRPLKVIVRLGEVWQEVPQSALALRISRKLEVDHILPHNQGGKDAPDSAFGVAAATANDHADRTRRGAKRSAAMHAQAFTFQTPTTGMSHEFRYASETHSEPFSRDEGGARLARREKPR